MCRTGSVKECQKMKDKMNLFKYPKEDNIYVIMVPWNLYQFLQKSC